MRSAEGIFYLPAVTSPKPAPTEQRRARESRSWPLRVISRQTSRDLSLTCPLSGLDLACCVSVWLDFASGTGSLAPRCRGPQERFAPVFVDVRVGSPGDPFADLENRQRRKSFVGSNPTPSVFLEWLLFSSSLAPAGLLGASRVASTNLMQVG